MCFPKRSRSKKRKKGRGKVSSPTPSEPPVEKSNENGEQGDKVDKDKEVEDVISKSAEIIKREVENPDSYVRLIGSLNEAKIVINGEETLGLIDSGAQISTMTLEFAEKLKLDIGSLNTILNIEGTGGNRVPYYGVVEAKMKIPGISEFDEYCAFLVIPESPYSKRVPLQIGTLHIDEAIRLIKVEKAAELRSEEHTSEL